MASLEWFRLKMFRVLFYTKLVFVGSLGVVVFSFSYKKCSEGLV